MQLKKYPLKGFHKWLKNSICFKLYYYFSIYEQENIDASLTRLSNLGINNFYATTVQVRINPSDAGHDRYV